MAGRTNSMNIPNKEIDAFLSRVDEATSSIKGLVDGSLKPEEVAIPGETAQERKIREEQEAARARRRLMNDKQRALDRAKALVKERERWWDLFEMTFGDPDAVSDPAGDADTKESKSEPPAHRKTSLDYSYWDKYVQNPDDPVSLEEAAAREAAEEDKRNAVFEEQNPDFVKQFKEDMADRKKAEERKIKNAKALRERGNKLFNEGHLRQAEDRYHEALRLRPHDLAILNNLAQLHFRRRHWGETLEFCKRVLCLDPSNVKALYRKAMVRREEGATSEVVELLTQAAGTTSAGGTGRGTKEVRRELRRAKSLLEEEEALAALGTPKPEVVLAVATSDASKATSTGAEPGTGTEAAAVVDARPDVEAPEVGAGAGAGAGAGTGAGAGAGPTTTAGVPAKAAVSPPSLPTPVEAGRSPDVPAARAPSVPAGGAKATGVTDELTAIAARLTRATSTSDGALTESQCLADLNFVIELESHPEQPPAVFVFARRCGVLNGLCTRFLGGRAACAARAGTAAPSGSTSDSSTAAATSDAFTSPLVQQRAQLAILALSDNVHNESVIRKSGALNAVVETACDTREEFLPAVAAAFAFLDRISLTHESCASKIGVDTAVLARIVGVLETLAAALAGTGKLQPLELEAATRAAALLQRLALHRRTAALVVRDAPLRELLPALLRLVSGVVSRCNTMGGMQLGGASVAETLVGSELIQSVTGALANFAHFPELRPDFVKTLTEGEDMPALTPLVDLLSVKVKAAGGPSSAAAKAAVIAKGSALAALANAGLDQPAVLHTLCRAGAVATLLKILKSKATPTVLLDRGAALLARLSSHPLVLEYMQHPKVLARITKVLCSEHCSTATFQRHMIRCVAAGMSTPALATVVDEHGGIGRLAMLLSDYVVDGNLTEKLVALTNLTRCIIVALQNPTTMSVLLAADISVPLIELLKNTSKPELKVLRRNVAIAIARVARDERGMARVRELRGMEILTQLSTELGV